MVHSVNNDPVSLSHHNHHNQSHNHPYSTNGSYNATITADSGGFLKSPLSQPGIISFTDISEKGGILYDTSGQAIQYTAATVPTSNVQQQQNGHAQSNQNGGLLMSVNTIDMIQSAIELQKQQQATMMVDPNSTDLSSQSTTATSMTLNSCAAATQPHPVASSINGVSPNGSSDTSAGSASMYFNNNQYLVSTDGSAPAQLDNGDVQFGTLQRNSSFRHQQLPATSNNGSLNGITPDILASNGYYVATDMSGALLGAQRVNICDYSNVPGHAQTQLPLQHHHGHHDHQQTSHFYQHDPAYPLLNTGQLISGRCFWFCFLARITRLKHFCLHDFFVCFVFWLELLD